MCSKEMAGKIVGLLFQDDPDHYDLVSKVGPGRVSRKIDYDIKSFKSTGKVDAHTGRVKAGAASRIGGIVSTHARRRPRMSDKQVNIMLDAISRTGKTIITRQEKADLQEKSRIRGHRLHFYHWRKQTKARKNHQCEICRNQILPGEVYVRYDCTPWGYPDNEGYHTYRNCRFCDHMNYDVIRIRAAGY